MIVELCTAVIVVVVVVAAAGAETACCTVTAVGHNKETEIAVL